MSSSKTLTPPLEDEPYKMERPTGQLFELKELQKQQYSSFSPDPLRDVPPPPGPPPGAPPPPVPQGGERGLREFNYNGRNVRPRDSEQQRNSVGRHRISSYSMYSNYSSYASSDDGRGGGDGDDGRGRMPPPSPPPPPPPPPLQAGHVERPPRRNPAMEAVPQLPPFVRPRGDVVSPPVRQPPPTYVPPPELYSRVRFADQERARREASASASASASRRAESRDPGPRQIELADVTGGHGTSTLWVFACCAFFWYRCLMDEDF